MNMDGSDTNTKFKWFLTSCFVSDSHMVWLSPVIGKWISLGFICFNRNFYLSVVDLWSFHSLCGDSALLCYYFTIFAVIFFPFEVTIWAICIILNLATTVTLPFVVVYKNKQTKTENKETNKRMKESIPPNTLKKKNHISNFTWTARRLGDVFVLRHYSATRQPAFCRMS